MEADMTKRRAVFFGLAAGIVVALGLGGAFLVFRPADAAASLAAPYDPECEAADEACRVWTAFRTNHPYPYQGFASARLQGGRALLVASEPPPDIPRAQAVELFDELFADGAPRVSTRKWFTGADGYVEDVLVEFDAPELKGDDLLQAAPLVDRIALLGLAWYGTAYGTEVEPIQRNRLKRTGAIAPNLDVTAGELRSWLADASLGWTPIEGDNASATTWNGLMSARSAGAYRSADGALVLLTFPEALLKDPSGPQELKAAFRRYAVASDATIGAAWAGGQVALVGRGRTHSLAQIPPLRFETFALLATQRRDALHQSYERTNTMAGKLINLDFDWAPIYLSAALQDTELGSLLNITDQMLKSWSQAGHIDYLYFDYPLRPDHFPFEKPLSEIVHDQQKTGGTNVLFNWNTAGSAAVLEDGKQKLLTAHSLGSLPITYGSDLQASGPTTTGHLTAFEEKAYSYFAGLGDPNLARVVQYTLMYQTFRAIAADEGSTAVSEPSSGPSSPGAKVLIDATRDILAKLESGNLAPPADWPIDKTELEQPIDAARKMLATLRSHQPEMSLDRLATVLADPRRVDPVTTAQEQTLAAGLRAVVDQERQLDTDKAAHDARVDALNSEIQSYLRQGHSEAEVMARFKGRIDDIKRQRAALDERDAQLQKTAEPYERFEADRNEVGQFRKTLRPLVMLSQDLGRVLTAYAQASAHPVDGWIRTPSFVTSRDREDSNAVGGHDIVARALRLVPDRSVTDVKIEKGPGGRRLLYNPDKVNAADHAARLSRAIEHGDADVAKLKTIVATPEAPRARAVALDMPATQTRWTARLGTNVFNSKPEFATELRTIKAGTACCRILAKDGNDVLYLAETNLRPPPGVQITSFGDTASFGNYMRAHGAAEDVIVLDQTAAHVDAMFASLSFDAAAPSRFAALKAAARDLVARSRQIVGGAEPGDHVLLTDLRGRGGRIDVPGGGSVSERADRMAWLVGRRTRGARVEPVSRQEAARVVGGINWDAAQSGAPTVVRVRFEGPGKLDVVAGFRSGGAAANQKLLERTVAKTLSQPKSDTQVAKLALTIKHELQALPDDQLRHVVFVVDEGGAKTQFTLAPTFERAARG
jgi:hypothetical protein